METKYSDVPVLTPATGKGLSAALWITQALLAALFLFAGVMKFKMPAEVMTKNSSLPLWFFYFIGVMEVLGGIGLILPAALHIRPILTPLADCGLAIIMVGATVITVPMGMGALFPCITGLLSIFIAYGRFRLRPVQPR